MGPREFDLDDTLSVRFFRILLAERHLGVCCLVHYMLLSTHLSHVLHRQGSNVI